MTISFNGSSSGCNTSGIKNLVINSAGHLIVTYSDNTIDDLGLVVGHDGADGTNFYPNEYGFEIPDDTFRLDKPLGWTYLSLTQPVSLYFKTSDADVTPSTWEFVEFGKGEKGDAGSPFTINSSGATLPTTGLVDNYTFYNTTDGSIYIYELSSTSWKGPFRFLGYQGEQGQFIIDSEGNDFPDITNLKIGYTFYNTETGYLYYVKSDSPTSQKYWSTGILFRGPKGEPGDPGLKGDPGDPANNIFAIKNEIDNSFENALLMIGTLPKGYLVCNIQVSVTEAYELAVNEMEVRIGGTIQSEIGSVVIAEADLFDINVARRYIVNEVNHDVDEVDDQIISCVFNESVNNSSTGKMTIIVTIMKQLPITPIADNI